MADQLAARYNAPVRTMAIYDMVQRADPRLCMIILAGIAGCAPQPVIAPKSQSIVPPPTAANATILSMRKVVANGNGNAWRGALLGNSSGGAAKTDPQSTVEFIVRADDGATLSIVERNAANFHPGDRVVIQRDDETHLVPPG